MIICIGESLIDFVPISQPTNGDESGAASLPEYRPVAGGCPYNCAISAARLGAKVAFVGTVSTDFFGDQLLSRLGDNTVDTSMIHRVDHPTTLAFVKKSPSGSARYAFYTISAADRAFSAEHVPVPIPAHAIVQIGSISLIADPEGATILDLAERERGRRIIAFDPNIRDTLITDEDDYRRRVDRALAATTVLKTSDEDLEWIYPGVSLDEAVRRVRRKGVELVVVTRGSEGSAAYTASRTVTVAAIDVEVSDTIGAGDSFLAALLVWLDEAGVVEPGSVGGLSIDELTEALEFASRVSAVTCTRVGAEPPYRSELGD